MTETKHTPEPSRHLRETLICETFHAPIGDTGDYEGHYIIRTENGGVWLADEVDPSNEVIDTHIRMVASYNALAGLNPEAVKDAVQALEDFLAGCEKLNPIHFDGGTQYGAFMRTIREQISAALANLKQTTP